MQGAQVRSLVKELDPTRRNQEFTGCNGRARIMQWKSKLPRATTKTQCSQINVKKRKEKKTSQQSREERDSNFPLQIPECLLWVMEMGRKASSRAI